MADSVSQSTNANPTVTYKTPTGQTVTSALQDATPQVQLLYQQLPQAQAQTSTAQSGAVSAQAGAQVAQVQAKTATQPLDLQSALSKGMSLGDALKNYSSLMKPDDIFNQYKAQKGLPKDISPTELQNSGVSDALIGKIGDNGSLADRWNTQQTILGLRDLQGKFHKTGQFSSLVNKTGLANLGFDQTAANSQAAYESGRSIFTQHLNSVIPGGSNAAGQIDSVAKSIPSSEDMRSYAPGQADSKFSSAEDQLLKAKGYGYSDLGLTAPTSQPQKTPKSGGDLLSTILGNAGKEVSAIGQSMAATSDPLKAILDPEAGAAYINASNPINTVKGLVKPYADIVTKGPAQAFKDNPVSTSLAVLGPLLGLKGGASGEAAGETGAAEAAATTADAFKGAPGKLSQVFTPGKAKNAIGSIRDNLISTADKNPDNVVSGDALAKNIRSWADQAKLSNLPDADAIEQAALNAEKQYAGKTFKPSDLKSIYDNIEGGYTKGSVPKSSTASYIDRGVQGLISKQLEQVAPGFQKTSDLFRQTFQAEKSPVKKYAKIGAGLGICAMGGNAVIDTVKKLLMAL